MSYTRETAFGILPASEGRTRRTLALMPKDLADSDEFRGAQLTRVDFSGATLRDVDLTDAKIVDAVLVNADVSGLIIGLRVNGVDVAPLVEAELDRRHPERVVMRSTTASGMRQGWAAVEVMWAPTIELGLGLPEPARHQRVLACLHVVTDEEWNHHQYAIRDLALLRGERELDA